MMAQEEAQEEVSLSSLTAEWQRLHNAQLMVRQKFALHVAQKKSHCEELESRREELEQSLLDVQAKLAKLKEEVTEAERLAVVIDGGVDLAASPAPIKQVSNDSVIPPRPKARAEEEPKPMPVGERMVAVMGTKKWKAAALEQAILEDSGPIESDQPRNYISNLFTSYKVRVPGPDGRDLRGKDGKFIKVARFRGGGGEYRLATPEEMEEEVRQQLGASEVIVSETPTLPEQACDDDSADDEASNQNIGAQILAEQGVDIGERARSPLDAVPHK